jgi:hypothetical protein
MRVLHQRWLAISLCSLPLLQVHLHEQFGNVFVDSCGGAVEAWVSPAAPVTLQVAAGGGIALDPALRVRGRGGGKQLTCQLVHAAVPAAGSMQQGIRTRSTTRLL